MRLIIFLIVFLFASCTNETLKPRDKYFKKRFNDVQSVQLPTARMLGIKPQMNRAGIKKQAKLVKIRSGRGYKIARLTHSSARVLPQTKKLINEIGSQFKDSLKKRSLYKERLVLTSLTRSREDQAKLYKTNINAVKQSAHFYGTTFDISYIRFKRDCNAKREILANVLENLRKKGRCYVKYEIQQKCFHITSR